VLTGRSNTYSNSARMTHIPAHFFFWNEEKFFILWNGSRELWFGWLWLTCFLVQKVKEMLFCSWLLTLMLKWLWFVWFNSNQRAKNKGKARLASKEKTAYHGNLVSGAEHKYLINEWSNASDIKRAWNHRFKIPKLKHCHCNVYLICFTTLEQSKWSKGQEKFKLSSVSQHYNAAFVTYRTHQYIEYAQSKALPDWHY